MKKLIMASFFALITTTAVADRTDFGVYGNWDAYRLNFPPAYSTDYASGLCAVRGVFGNNYKVIFARYNAGVPYRMMLEHPSWNFQPGYSKNVNIQLKNKMGYIIYDNWVLVQNNSQYTVKQIPFAVDFDFFKKVAGPGFELIIATPGEPLRFNINEPGLEEAFDRGWVSCMSTLFPEVNVGSMRTVPRNVSPF